MRNVIVKGLKVIFLIITMCFLIGHGLGGSSEGRACDEYLDNPSTICIDRETTVEEFESFNSIEIIEGDLLVLRSEVSNLSFFENLNRINGSFRLENSYDLQSFDGLENLVKIGGSLEMSMLSSLRNLSGLSSLTEIGGGLDIHSNSSLEDLGLTSLDEVGSPDLVNNTVSFYIYGNHNLYDHIAYDLLDQIGGESDHLDV